MDKLFRWGLLAAGAYFGLKWWEQNGLQPWATPAYIECVRSGKTHEQCRHLMEMAWRSSKVRHIPPFHGVGADGVIRPMDESEFPKALGYHQRAIQLGYAKDVQRTARGDLRGAPAWVARAAQQALTEAGLTW